MPGARPSAHAAAAATGSCAPHAARQRTPGSSAAGRIDAGSSRYSPVLPWLRLYGLRDLLGINLEFEREFRRDGVRFRHGDVTVTGLPDASLDALTCLSVIEHGVALRPFFAKAARVLRPGGVLRVSTDYARQPPDTSVLRAYGVSVRVFGPADLRVMLDPAHRESPVHWRRMGLRFTFAPLGLRRR